VTERDLSARRSQIVPPEADRYRIWDSEILKRLLNNGRVTVEECKDLPGYQDAKDPRTAGQNVRRRFHQLAKTVPRLRVLSNGERTVIGLELFDPSLKDKIRKAIDLCNMNHQPVTKERILELVGTIRHKSDFDEEWSNFARELLTMPYSARPYLEQLEERTRNPQPECEHSFYSIEPNGIGYCLRCGTEGP